MKLEDYISITKDFPKEGILFKDMSPLLADKKAFKFAVDTMTDLAKDLHANVIVGPESRGFVFGTPLAYNLNIGFVMARKPGKLPGKTMKVSYKLEYGENTIHLPNNSIKKGDKVLIVDDLLATGGTVGAIIDLCNSVGAEVVGIITLIELTKLVDEENLKGVKHYSLIKYDY